MPGEGQHVAVPGVDHGGAAERARRAPRPRRPGSSGRSSSGSARPSTGSLEASSSRSPSPTASSSPPGRAGRGRRRTRARGRSSPPARPRGSRGPRAPSRCSPLRARPISPVTMPPAPLVTRASAGPSASGERSAARIGARFGQPRLAVELLALLQAGEDQVGRHSIALVADRARAISPSIVPKAVVSIVTGSATTLSPSWSSGPRVSPTAIEVGGRRPLRPRRRPSRAPRRRTSPLGAGAQLRAPSPRSRPRSRPSPKRVTASRSPESPESAIPTTKATTASDRQRRGAKDQAAPAGRGRRGPAAHRCARVVTRDGSGSLIDRVA